MTATKRRGAKAGTLSPAPMLALFPRPPLTPRVPTNDTFGWADEGSDSWVAERCGVSTRTVQRWRRGALLQVATADRVACELGMHPAEIWGDDWWQA